MEKRYITTEEQRAFEVDGTHILEGYALKFNTRSNPIGGHFVEEISDRALESTDMSDVLGRVNHGSDMGNVFARTGVNLTLTVDETGLFYRAVLDPDSPRDMQLYRDTKRGLISKSSFAFMVREGGDVWRREGEVNVRTVTDIEVLGDIAPVHRPAYDDTSSIASQRTLDSLKEFEEKLAKESKKDEEESRDIKTPLNIDDKARYLILKTEK